MQHRIPRKKQRRKLNFEANRDFQKEQNNS